MELTNHYAFFYGDGPLADAYTQCISVYTFTGENQTTTKSAVQVNTRNFTLTPSVCSLQAYVIFHFNAFIG